MIERLQHLINEHGLERMADQILFSVSPGVQLVRQPSRDEYPGSSRLGGVPDLPAGFAWPKSNERSLGFLGQINCAELAPFVTEKVLPTFGMLYFFYDLQELPLGFDPKHRSGFKVAYGPADKLSLATPPPSLQHLLPGSPIGFRPVLTLPGIGSVQFDAFEFSDDEMDTYFRLHDALMKDSYRGQPAHQLLGHSDNLHGDMQLDCQLVTHGISCGDPAGYADPRARNLETGAGDWRLLLQLDSDPKLGFDWGANGSCDPGMVYFWMREKDLAEQDFDKTWVILQCE